MNQLNLRIRNHDDDTQHDVDRIAVVMVTSESVSCGADSSEGGVSDAVKHIGRG